MSTAPTTPLGLRFVPDSPVAGLAVAERRVPRPEATLICSHGGLDRGGSFARLARRVDDFDVVAYDRRGYQGSRSLTPLSLEWHVADLLALVKREAARGPVILLGHSFGGVVTFGAALAEPTLVSMVVNYESPCPWVLARPSRSPELADDPALAAEQFFRRMVSRGAWDRLSEAERESRRLDGPALLSDLRRMRGPAPYDLGDLTVPSVYVHGDWLLAPYYQALCVALHQLNPRITCREMRHAGHGAHLSNPDQLAALIHELWSERCASA